MRPVVLIVLPNCNYMLGTFDTTNFATWWKSGPMDGVENIIKGMQIYGSYHIALTKLTNGSYAVWQSNNYGQTWTKVWTSSSQIYDIVKIAYGWAIANAADGFWETTNSGTNWSNILGLPDAPIASAIANVGHGDILMCTDGHHVWKSTNYARSWTLSLDVATQCQFAGYEDYPTPVFRYTEDKLSVPCIAGANGRVVIGCGPFLIHTNNNGGEWAVWNYWDHYYGSIKSLLPPKAIVHSRIYPNTFPLQFVINQILITDIDGPTGGDVQFLITYKDLIKYNNEDLMVRAFLTYDYYESSTDQHYYNQFLEYKSQQNYTQASGQTINWYQTLRAGSDQTDSLLVSTYQTTDSSGNKVTGLKKSTDGGKTWTIIDLTTVTVVDGNNVSSVGGSFIDDNYGNAIWTYGECNNVGDWSYETGICRRNISFDMDYMIPATYTKYYILDHMRKKAYSKSYTFDQLVKKRMQKTYNIDQLVRTTFNKGHLPDFLAKKAFEISYALDQIIVHRYLKTVIFQSYVRKTIDVSTRNDLYCQKEVESSCSMGLDIHDTIVWDILTNTETYSIQLPDIGSTWKRRSYNIFDSRKTPKK